jgi:hypothetical protein
MEQTNKQMESIIIDKNLCFRVVADSSGKKALFSQKGGFETFFSGPVQRMIWQNGIFQIAEALSLPNEVNLYDFTFGHFLSRTEVNRVDVKPNEHLKMTIDNQLKWDSDEPYGGNYIHLASPQVYINAESNKKGDPFPEIYAYLPQRFHVIDPDHDGIDSLLVLNNFDATGRVFQRIRVFRYGKFECLSWGNDEMYPLWETPQFSGYISDSAWDDINNDGIPDLIFSLVTKGAGGFGKSESNIVIIKR